MEIVPPEVPRLEKKKGFFERLFLAKKEEAPKQLVDTQSIELPELPELPIMDIPEPQQIKSTSQAKTTKVKNVGKSKGKGKKTSIGHLDETKSFDWTQSINSQNQTIEDSNRSNKDINKLIQATDQHVEVQKKVLAEDTLSLPENLPDLKFDNPIVLENNIQVEPIPEEEKKFFDKVDNSHKKLRDKLKKSMTKTNKQEFVKLLKEYDSKIESLIEQRQLEFSHKNRKLSALNKNLIEKQKELNTLQKNLKLLQDRLNDKEKTIEQTINKTVDKQLIIRSKKEKELLRRELQKTISMNKELKKKLDNIEKDEIILENTRSKISEEYRSKTITLQSTYEKKLLELQREKDDFDLRKKNAMELLHKAEVIHKERENMERLKDMVEKKKEVLNESLYADRELKKAIENSELKLAEDREKLDNMIFSKYIEWKLSEPDDSQKITDIIKNPTVDEINNLIADCRGRLLNGQIADAKKMYNSIKHKFETYDIDEYNRSELFNNIRQLYSDIQIAALKP